MNGDKKKVFFDKKAADKAKEIETLCQSIWEYAEPGYKEVKSMAAMTELMEREGFIVEKGIGGIETACVCRYGTGHPRIGILAEYDALPMLSQEAGNCEKKPVEGKECGHGCGHNALCAGAAGAAILLKEYLKMTEAEGTVELYGCPAEESGAGKVYMIKEHCFDGVDVVFNWHPEFFNTAAAVTTNAYYQVEFEFCGISAHAAACPEEGRSALDACELMNVGVNYLREHVSTEVRIHYAYLDCGGGSPNVVQSTGKLLYYIRAPKLRGCKEVLERTVEIAKGAAQMTGTKMDYRIIGGLNELVPNKELSQVLDEGLHVMGGPQFGEAEYRIAREFYNAWTEEKRAKLEEEYNLPHDFREKPLLTGSVPYDQEKEPRNIAGSTDVGDVSYLIPTALMFAACGVPGTVLHSYQATAQMGTSIGAKGAECAAKAMAYAGSTIVDQPEIVQKAQRELKNRTKGVYISPLEEIRLGERRI